MEPRDDRRLRPDANKPVVGLVLAGGSATRMGGGDKGLLEVGGLPIMDRVLETMRAQCAAVVLCANGDPVRFGARRVPVVTDETNDRLGPLAGILAGLDWIAAHYSGAASAVSVPWDTPFAPADLVARLTVGARETDEIVVARSGGRRHSTVALWPISVRQALRDALMRDGLRKVGGFLDDQGARSVDWGTEPYDPFFNVNTPDDLATAEALAREAACGRYPLRL